jgi:hypothetical protein
VSDLRTALVERIKRRLVSNQFCTVFDADLALLSAPVVNLRRMQVRDIERFATDNGYHVKIRDAGLSATFRKSAR